MTLIEVMVLLAIVGMIVVGAITGISRAATSVTKSDTGLSDAIEVIAARAQEAGAYDTLSTGVANFKNSQWTLDTTTMQSGCSSGPTCVTINESYLTGGSVNGVPFADLEITGTNPTTGETRSRRVVLQQEASDPSATPYPLVTPAP